jgi:hypothetical protein
MKVLIGAAAAVLLIAAPAGAQTGTTAPAATAGASQCGAVPEMPTLPDGADAGRNDMESANTAYTAWSANVRTNLDCRRAEAQSLQTQADARIAEHNAAAAALATANTNWQAEVEEFNGRTGNRR